MAQVQQRHEERRRAQRHADRARREADERRNRDSGVTGWVADRAGEWTLDEQDWDFIERQKYFWNPLLDYWFRMEVSGWERLPEPPALVVGIHSGEGADYQSRNITANRRVVRHAFRVPRSSPNTA